MDERSLAIGESDDRARLLAIIERLLEIGSMDVAGALDEASDLVRAALGADVASVLLLDGSTDSLVAAGVSAGEMGRRERAIGMDRLPLANDGPTVGVFRTGVPRVTGRAEEDPSELPGFTRGLGVRSIVEAPLSVGHERRGVLSAFSRQPDRFTGADLRFLELVARWVGTVAERGALSERVVSAAAESSRRAASEQALALQALHDPLTGLPNRALFMDRFGQAIAHLARREHPLAVLFIDFDRFKSINDSLGHDVGDRVLIEAARRIRASLRPTDTAARFGGDELVVLLDEITDESDAVRVVERLLAAIAAPFVIERRAVHVRVSVGVAVGETGIERPTDLLRNADVAMYRAKERGGGGGFEVYDKSIGIRVSRRLELEHDLQRAIDREEFVLYYQPKVWLDSGRIESMEALLRWRHPERGLLPPGEFIDLAEVSGLIVPIGRWIFGEACAQAHAWRERLPEGRAVPVCVNVSPRQFRHGEGLLREVGHVLRDTGLDPRFLRLELTEGAFAGGEDGVAETLGALRALGVALAIDDFGTGYSSLSHLKRFPVDILKIDRAFVSGLGNGGGDEAIAQAVLTLATALGRQVHAEGIETPEQRAILRAMGCPVGQGYLFARPLPSDEAAAALARGSYGVQ